jgi:hypothetical protein
MRTTIIAAAAFVAACSPAPSDQATTETPAADSAEQPQAPDPERDAMVAALSPAASADIGRPVTFTVMTKRTDGDWGWLVAQPWTPEGAALDWSTTRYATQAREGVLDGGGTTYALLHRQNGQWTVTAFAVGPTDVAWADWPQRYGAPAELMEVGEGQK